MVKLRGQESYPFYFGASPDILRKASELRQNMTKAKKALWEELRNKKLGDYRFRRQHPIGIFIVDFFCFESMLAIELDGGIHDTDYQRERDFERTIMLREHGIAEIRFRNKDIFDNMDRVLIEIGRHLILNN